MSDFKTELQEIPNKLEETGLLLADAKKNEALAKLLKEDTAAKFDGVARDTLGGDKKPTEAAISNFVKSHPVMQDVEKKLVDASYEVDKLRSAYEALKAKKDILLALVAEVK